MNAITGLFVFLVSYGFAMAICLWAEPRVRAARRWSAIRAAKRRERGIT